MSNLKFSESGVRGVVGETLTPQLVTALAVAFGKYVGGGTVVVGRDTRTSGPMFEQAVIAGLLAAGCRPVLLGIVPTPTVQIMVGELRAHGGIAVTASHNPSQWNALKFIGARGMFLDRNEAAELFDIYNQGVPYCEEEAGLQVAESLPDAFAIHQAKVFAAVDVDLIRSCRFKVAIDCCDGVGAVCSVDFLKALNCEVTALHTRTDGIFGRPPEPVDENLGDLCSAVRENRCAIGFAHDPDGDRMALVDNLGRPMGTNATIMLPVAHVLSKHPGPVAVNLQTTKAVEDIATAVGCRVFYSKVGEINVVEKMLAEKAEIGGEGSSAGLIWRRVHAGRDAYVAMALALEMLASRRESAAEIFDSLPRYHNCTAKFEASPYAAREVILILARRYEALDPLTIDGVRIDFPEGWVLVRQSNTERVLRMNAEAGTAAAAEALLRRLRAEIETILQEFNG